MGNVETVKEIYAAFGRGDIAAILGRLAEDVRWDAELDVPGVPWLQPRRGRRNIPAFFESLAPMQFTRFEPHTFFREGNQVLSLVHIEATVHGKQYRIRNEGHLWTFDAGGTIVDFEHVTDTAVHQRMARGE